MPLKTLCALANRIGTERASSRAVALIRIGIPLLLWSRLGSEFAFFDAPLTASRAALGTAFFASTTSMLVGLFARTSAFIVSAVMCVAIATRGVLGGDHVFLHHHVALLVIVAFVLCLTPCGASFSIDRMRAVARSETLGAAPPEEKGYVYGQWLIRAQIALVYLFAAIDKSDAVFLSGARMGHYVHFFLVGSSEVSGAWFPVIMRIAAVTTVALEYALAVLLFVPRLRRILIPLGLGFHALVYVTLPVHTFSLTMALLYLAVLDPDVVHRRIDTLVGRSDP